MTEAHAAFPAAKNPLSSIVYTWLFQAMTQHRLGHAEEARGWLKKAVKDLDQPPSERPQDGAGGAWNRRLTLQLLRREAEELLGIKQPPPEILPPPTEEAQKKR